MLVVAGLLIVTDVEAFMIITTLTLPFLLPFASPLVDDVARVTVVVDGATSIHAPSLASLAPVPTTRLLAGGGPTG